MGLNRRGNRGEDSGRAARLIAGLLLLALVLAACDMGGAPPATPLPPTPAPAPPTATTAAPLTATSAVVPSATTAATATTGSAATPTAKPALDAVPGVTPTAPPDKAVAPLWVRDAVLYQIFVRNFTPEGTLAAAQQRLADLHDMGVTLIYLMPIHPLGKVQRKGSLGSPYSIADYDAIDPALGTEADLKALVDAAHGMGMKVIMDLVANHTAWDSVLAQQHPDWFKHDAQGQFVPPQPDWSDVIQIDHSQPAVLDYFITMTTHYMQADGVDGWRCDYSTGVPLDFWKAWRAALKTVNPDVFLLSENDNATLTQAFDATYDQTLYRDVSSAIQGHNPHWLVGDAAKQYQTNGPYLLQMRFYENHDHNRVAVPFQTLPLEALETASTYFLTTSGVPFIENGQEVGITHTIALFEPDPIPWAQGNSALRDFFKRILTIRHATPALRHGDIVDLGTLVPGVTGFLRRTANQQVLVLLSFAQEPTHITLDPALARHPGQDVAAGSPVDLSAGLDLTPWSWRIIELKK